MEPHAQEHLLTLTQALQGHMRGYEPRSSQVAMMQSVSRCIEKSQILLVEAPTGTGKTLAYLLPALEWAKRHKKRIVVATYTLPLQEQIFKKDLPLACKILDAELSKAMLKGRNNYLCLKKAHEWLGMGARHEKQQSLLEGVRNWMSLAKEGNRSEGPSIDNETWYELAADEECTRQKCPHYNDCFYFSHRKKAQQADVLVVNHHLLAQEMKRREQEGPSLLGDWDLLIIDEAHHLTDVLTRQLAIFMSHDIMAQIWARLWVGPRAKVAARGWLTLIDQKMGGQLSQAGDPRHLMWLDTVQAIDRQWELASDLSQAMSLLAFSAKNGVLELEGDWVEAPAQSLVRVLEILNSYRDSLGYTLSMLDTLGSYFKQLEENEALAIAGAIYQEYLVHKRLLERHRTDCNLLLKVYDPQKEVGWIEWDSQGRWEMVLASLDLKAAIDRHLFKMSRSVVMCSATLGGCQAFEPLVSEVGVDLKAEGINSLSLPSNFDWVRQSCLIACEDMPDPSGPRHLLDSIEAIKEMLGNVQGRCLVLTTSMSALKKLHEGLNFLSALEPPRELLVQGYGSREQLLKKFALNKNAVLMGADSFWEGIDLDGQPISLVVIVRLPFEVPSDPLLKAKADHFFGEKAFHQFHLPRAVLRFQQGVGRLLRHSQDKGCIVCLDSRLCHARYGARFKKVGYPAQWMNLPRAQLGAKLASFL